MGGVADVVSDVVDTITPWNDDTKLGKIATGVAIGVATGGAAAALGAGMATAVGAGIAAGGVYEQSKQAEKIQDQIKRQEEEMRREYEKQMQELEAERRARLAKLRREQLAAGILQAVTEADRVTDVAVNKIQYTSNIPSLGGTIDMSQTGG